MVRFFNPAAFTQKTGDLWELSSEEKKHAKVVRLKQGEPLEFLDGAGGRLLGVYTGEGKVLVESLKREERPHRNCVLVVGVTQGGTFEVILRQAVELGVAQIVPLRSQNAAPMGDDKRIKSKFERWGKIIEESCKQSGLAWKPELVEPIDFKEALARLGGAVNIVGALGRKTVGWQSIAPKKINALWVGPEGDFTAQEYADLEKVGAYFVSLGKVVLRTETAVVAGLALLAECVKR